jgi:uncharacterized protein (TIGR02271 family)
VARQQTDLTVLLARERNVACTLAGIPFASKAHNDRCEAPTSLRSIHEDPAVKTNPHIREERVDTHEPGIDAQPSSREAETVVPVLKEELDVRTRRVETDSGVRIAKTVQEREEIVDQPLTREEVDVERVAVNRRVDGAPAVRYEGDTMVVPILEEVLVVEKHLILKEEIRITRRKSVFRAPQRVALRNEVAAVERIEDRERALSPASIDSSRAEPESRESLLEHRRRQHDDLRRRLDPPASRE